MEIRRLAAAAPPSPCKIVVDKDQVREVPADKAEIAAKIDADHSGLITDDKLKTYLRSAHILKDQEPHARVATDHIVGDYKRWLLDGPRTQDAKYHTYDEQHDILAGLAQEHPDRAELISVGKTPEGRDIWGLRITGSIAQDASNKPGVVYTGCHHAREWMSMEVPLDLAQNLVNNYDSDADTKRRVDNAEIWVIPTVNPDGYEYSRTQDPWWRKNREPITDTGCGNVASCNLPKSANGQPVAYGVDLNRNYDDGKPEHATLYRPAGDKPCDSSDDIGVVSDDPNSDVYRGPKGASEPETRAMLALELGKPNVVGVIDHHGYSELFLRPWGYTTDKPDNIKDYDEVAGRMLKAQSNPYTYESAMDLYPTSGTSTDTLAANGKIAFTIELGQEFQPDPATFDKANVENADLAFLDWIEEKHPVQTPPPPDPQPPTPEPQP